jgi:hypothetical protein
MGVTRSPSSHHAKPAIRLERRAYPRHKPAVRTTCLVESDSYPTPSRAVVQNLSGRGLALIVRDWYEPGEVLSVRLFNESVTFCLRAKLRLTRRCTLPEGDYFIAGELDRVLEPAELLPFLVG